MKLKVGDIFTVGTDNERGKIIRRNKHYPENFDIQNTSSGRILTNCSQDFIVSAFRFRLLPSIINPNFKEYIKAESKIEGKKYRKVKYKKRSKFGSNSAQHQSLLTNQSIKNSLLT